MWGEIGFPGDDAVEAEAAPIIGGTLDNWRLDVDDDRCNKRDDDIESDNAALESLIFWNLERVAVGRLSVPLASLDGRKLLRSFFRSSILRKSPILSASVGSEEAPTPVPASFRILDPGWAEEEVRLPLPLLFSSSVLLAPPEERRPFRWPKLLVYLLIEPGRDDAVPEDAAASGGT